MSIRRDRINKQRTCPRVILLGHSKYCCSQLILVMCRLRNSNSCLYIIDQLISIAETVPISQYILAGNENPLNHFFRILSENEIEDIQRGAFSNLPNLEFL